MRYPGAGAWHIVVISKKDSERVGKVSMGTNKKWGFVYVKALIGNTTWDTSLWPKQKEGVYLLVIKTPFRKKEVILEGDTVRVTITLT